MIFFKFFKITNLIWTADFEAVDRTSTHFHANGQWGRLLQNFKYYVSAIVVSCVPFPARASVIKTWIILRTWTAQNKRGGLCQWRARWRRLFKFNLVAHRLIFDSIIAIVKRYRWWKITVHHEFFMVRHKARQWYYEDPLSSVLILSRKKKRKSQRNLQRYFVIKIIRIICT